MAEKKETCNVYGHLKQDDDVMLLFFFHRFQSCMGSCHGIRTLRSFLSGNQWLKLHRIVALYEYSNKLNSQNMLCQYPEIAFVEESQSLQRHLVT